MIHTYAFSRGAGGGSVFYTAPSSLQYYGRSLRSYSGDRKLILGLGAASLVSAVTGHPGAALRFGAANALSSAAIGRGNYRSGVAYGGRGAAFYGRGLRGDTA
jgi:hypothetical protein